MTALDALNLAAPLADTYNNVEQRLLVSIARQLSLNDTHELNEVSKWQIKRLANLGMLRKDAARIIAAGTKGVPADFADTVQQAITSALAEDGLTDMWQDEGFSESAKNAVKHYRNQAKDVYNQVNTVMKYKAESSFVSAVNSVADKWTQDMRRQQAEIADKQGFLDILNSNTANVVNGSAARTKAVRTTIHEMAQKGIPAFVDRSGREWSPEAYVNMDIRATVKNTALEAKFSVMDSLGQDVFEVSSHPGSRPKCRPWQGKLISRSGKTTEITDLHGRKHKVIPLSQTSFGEPDGLFGINCGHRPRGCSEGVFTKSAVEYDDEEDKALYNKVCKQRELERKVRKSKTEADMLEAAGDTEGAKEVRRRMAEQNKALRAYCEENGLKYRSDRVRTYGSVKPTSPKQEAGVQHMSALSASDWREAKPIKHAKKELEELHEFARNNNIHFIEPTKFDGDIELCKEQITVMSSLIADLNIKGKISLGYSVMPPNDMGLTSKNNRTVFINKLSGRNRQLTNSILNSDNQLSPTDAIGIGAHEIGHVWVAQYGSRGIDIARKAYYNIYKEDISALDILDFLEENISIYSTQTKKSARKKWFKQSNYSEIIPEVLAANVTKPTNFTSEFVRLMKEVSAHDKT